MLCVSVLFFGVRACGGLVRCADVMSCLPLCATLSAFGGVPGVRVRGCGVGASLLVWGAFLGLRVGGLQVEDPL